MCGTPPNAEKGWELILGRLGQDPPTPVGRFLGCEHNVAERMRNGRIVKCMEYDTSGFLEQC
eukprot:3721013-Alexandrium_andersonii.AAC.1